MATDNPSPGALPGDIIQIIDQSLWCHSHLALVQEVRRWGVGAVFRYPAGRDDTAETYIRLKPDQFVVCGAAHLLPGDLAQARRESLKLADQITKDAGQ